ncbi:MAG: proline dehydrogenase [Proteobacteria bacterium]|nr:MAG: proline dehydrogenase [Pseudomonadota bacterium]
MFSLFSMTKLMRIGEVLLSVCSSLKIPTAWAFRSSIFPHFCGGENCEEALNRAQDLMKRNVGAILDFSVEGSRSEESFEATKDELLKVIARLGKKPQGVNAYAAVKLTGLGDHEVLERIQSGEFVKNADLAAFKRIEDRLDQVAGAAKMAGVRLIVDAEESWIQGSIDRLTETVMQKYNKQGVSVYTTLQMYRADRLQYFEELLQRSEQEGYELGLKIVRGAYLEKENARAKELGVPSPIHLSKHATDQAYHAAIELAFQNLDRVWLCIATHNESSSRQGVQLLENALAGGVNDLSRVSFAQLLGMSDHISFNLAEAGLEVLKYVPYGPIGDVIPYLLRRMKENSGIRDQTDRELRLIRKEIERRAGEMN